MSKRQKVTVAKRCIICRRRYKADLENAAYRKQCGTEKCKAAFMAKKGMLKKHAARTTSRNSNVYVEDWLRLVNRYGGRCAYCGKKEKLTLDHVIPIDRGGRHAIGNFVPACGSCNSIKTNMFLIEWKKIQRDRAATPIYYELMRTPKYRLMNKVGKQWDYLLYPAGSSVRVIDSNTTGVTTGVIRSNGMALQVLTEEGIKRIVKVSQLRKLR